MELASVCLVLSALSVAPDRSQFFLYDNISLSCAAAPGSGGWTVRRNTSLRSSQRCQFGWAIPRESGCTIEDADPSDTGVYWCESARGERSDAVNITVTDGAVILESPALPVTEGDAVTLRCSRGEETRSAARFFRNDVFIGAEDAGQLVLPAVDTSDEGPYRCERPPGSTSPQSWMAVRVRAQGTGAPLPPAPAPGPLRACVVLLLVLYAAALMASLCVYRRLARVREEMQQLMFRTCVSEASF